MPRTRPTGPIRTASPTTMGSEPRSAASVSTKGSARAGSRRPQGIPAGATRTSRRVRSGLRAASSAATRPPSEWPARSTRPRLTASSQRASHALSAAAPTDRPGRGRSTAYSRRRSASGSSSGDHQRQEPASPCTRTSGSPLPATRYRKVRPSRSTSSSWVSTNRLRIAASGVARYSQEAVSGPLLIDAARAKAQLPSGPRSSVDRAAVS
jgi:hypothetical protein